MSSTAAAPSSPRLADEQTIFEGAPAALDSLGRWTLAIVTLGLAALYYWFGKIGHRIKLTDQRLILKTGILTARTESIELYRVTDLLVEEPLGERIFGYGRIAITSSDRSEPRLVLRGIKHPDALADKLRACVEEQKRSRRVATLAEA
jgi:uncharacterized membrane protein YdbT with pleckstrin-like domain